MEESVGAGGGQLLFGLGGMVGFIPAWVVAGVSSRYVADKMGWQVPWVEVREKNGVVSFEVEYRRAMTLGAEYDRRVAFASGKRVGIATDTGGYSQLAAYAPEDGTHALVAGAGNLFRVNAADETVDADCGGRWFRLPGGTEEVGRRGMGRVTDELADGESQSIRDGMSVG